MKILTDFVTNSSSSSFVVSITKLTDKKKLAKILLKTGDDIQEFFNDMNNYASWAMEDIHTVEDMADEMAENFLENKPLEIGNKKVYGGRGGSEDLSVNLFDFLYMCNPKFKGNSLQYKSFD